MKITHKFALLQNLSLILLTFTLIACEQQNVDSTAPTAETGAVDETAPDRRGWWQGGTHCCF